MHAQVSRLLAAASAVLAGGLAGTLVGPAGGASWRYAVAGALIGAIAFAARDAWLAGRLLRWLRGPQDTPAPRHAGLWGELGYRFERSLRKREREVALERDRLTHFLDAIQASPNGIVLLDEQDRIVWS